MSNHLALGEIFQNIKDPRQQDKIAYNLSEILVVAVAAILCKEMLINVTEQIQV